MNAVCELQNVETSQKYFHQITTELTVIDYYYIINTIYLYEPQCEGETLSIMYCEDDSWIFMSGNFKLDIKHNVNDNQKDTQKNKMSRITSNSKLTNKSSQIHTSSITSNSLNKSKSLIKVRFHCQTWLQDKRIQEVPNVSHNYYSISSLERNSEQDKLIKKIFQLKQKIKEMEKVSYQLSDQFQSDPLDINLYWACPLFATDGVKRKQQKGKKNKKGYKPYDENKIGEAEPLKNQIKYGVYLNPIIQQIKNSNKKVLLQVDLFNKKTFEQKNIFKIVYLICHTQPIMNDQSVYIQLDVVNQNVEQAQEFEVPQLKIRKTQSKIVQEKDQESGSEQEKQEQTQDIFDDLEGIQQQKQSRKQSTNSIQELSQISIQDWQLDEKGYSLYSKDQVSSVKQTSKKKFQFRKYKQDQLKLKNSRDKQINIQFSNNNDGEKKRWTKQQKRQFKKKRNSNKKQKYRFGDKNNNNNNNANASKKYKKPSQTVYFIGQNQHGQLQKISPSELDEMLSKDKKQNIELFILHSSYPFAHLPIIQKHANNILLINSNPLNPQSCTIFFLQKFFRYLLQKKQIKLAYQQAFAQTSAIYQQKKQQNQHFNQNTSSLVKQQSKQDRQLSKKYKTGSHFSCCCYHKHQSWCQFKNTISTSKFSDCHYKYHIHRCDCDVIDTMVHHCDQKRKDLRTFGIISKDYHQKNYYYCCCQGFNLKKYPYARYNKQNFLQNCQLVDDFHSMKHKFQMRKTSQLSLKQQKKEQSQSLLDIVDGEPRGDLDKRYMESFKFISQNTLIGNKQLIVDMMKFFTDYEQMFEDLELPTLNMKKSQSAKDQMKQSQRLNSKLAGSLLRQNQQYPQNNGSKYRQNNPYIDERKIFNIYGESSTGRKKISIFLANLLIIKQIFTKYMIKQFSSIEQLKSLQANEQKPIFYILIYKHQKTQNQPVIKRLFMKSEKLPKFINAILITTKEISYDSSIKVKCRSPQAFDKFQTMSFVKIYKHLNNQYKKKLQKFMDLTYNQLNEQTNNKIYPNNLDPNQVICMLNKSHYEFSQGYLSSLLKISQQNISKYIFIMSIVFETIKQQNSSQSLDFKKKVKSEIVKKLNFLMDQKQGFFKQQESKQSNKAQKKKNKKKNKNKKKKTDNCDQIEQYQEQKEEKQTKNKRFDANDMKKVINIDMVLMYFPLIFQKLKDQIKQNSLQILKMYIHYSTINFSSAISNKETFQKAKFKQIQRQNTLKNNSGANYRTRLVKYEPQFYQISTLNSKSFIHQILKKEMIESEHYYVKKQHFRDTVQSIPQLYQKQKNNKQEHSINQFIVFHAQTIKSYFAKQKQNKFVFAYDNEVVQNLKQSKSKYKPSYQAVMSSTKSIPSESNSFQNQLVKTQRLKYFQHIKHVKYILQAALNFVRSIMCSHLIYNKFQLNQKVHMLSLSLLLINNAIIFMKNPYWNAKMQISDNQDSNKSDQSIVSAVDSTQLNESFIIEGDQDNNDDTEAKYSKINKESVGDRDIKTSNIKTSKNIASKLKKTLSIQVDLKLKQKNFSSNQKDIENNRQQKKQKQKKNLNNQTHKKNNFKQKNSYVQEDIFFQSIISLKGLLYLLTKINLRCSSLLLQLTNNSQNTTKKQSQIKNLSILTDLLSLQVNIDAIFATQKIIQQNYVPKQTSYQKFLNSMFNDQGKRLKQIQNKIQNNYHSYQNSVVLQDHFISSYILLITRCGRIRITQSMANDILKIKNDLDQKINKAVVKQQHVAQQRRNSINDDNIIQKTEIVHKKKKYFGRLKILHRICQNERVFNKINVPFNIYQAQQNQILQTDKNELKLTPLYQSVRYGHSLHKDVYRSINEHHHSASKQTQSIQKQRHSSTQKYFTKQDSRNQSFIYDNLLEKYHMLQKTLNNGTSEATYEMASKLYQELTSSQLNYNIIYCSRYIHDFKKDFKNKIVNQLNILKQKLFVILEAHPLEYGKNNYKLHSDSKQSGSQVQSKASSNSFYQGSMNQDHQIKKKINQQNLKKTAILSQLIFNVGQDLQNKSLQISLSLKQSMSVDSLTLKSRQKSSFSDYRQNPQKISINQKQETKNYSNFFLKLKMNMQNIRQLKECFGCKYLCINTSMAIDNQKQIIGEQKNGQTIFFQKEWFIKQISELAPPILFICLPKQRNFAQYLVKNNYKKEIVYFNFQDYPRQHQTVIRAYQRLIMLEVIKLIFRQMLSNQSQILRLKNAFNYVLNNYQFSITNEYQKEVFRLSNQQLKKSTFMNFYELDQEKVQPKTLVKLNCKDIAFQKEISQVKKVLEGRLLSSQKKMKKIQQISFQKFFQILKFYLKNKENFQNFYVIDLDQFRRNKDPYDLSMSKLSQKHSSHSSSNLELQKNASGQSSKKKKQSKKSKESYCFSFQETPFNLRWKSALFKHLLDMNILDFYYSKRKGVIAFVNSQILTEDRYSSKETWAKDMFMQIFNSEIDQSIEELKRVKTVMKLQFSKQSDESSSIKQHKQKMEVTLFFMEEMA